VNKCYSLKCQDTTEGQDVMMQRHLKKLGYYYYQLKIKYLKNTLTCFQLYCSSWWDNYIV